MELVTRGVGFGVVIVAGPLGVEIARKGTTRVLRYMLGRFAHIYEDGELKLTEVVGREIPDQRYSGVGEFWTKVVGHGLENDALIEITGLLSPYGPLTPAHPMSRPGYTVEGWEAMGKLETEDTEEYDTRDGFIYGDRVLCLSRPRHQKYYAGLYDAYFGISNVSIPLYVDEIAFRPRRHELRQLRELWQYPMSGGRIVKVKGRLRNIPNFYAQFVSQPSVKSSEPYRLPEQYCSLPSFGLEVFKIEVLPEPQGVTHMAISLCWDKKGDERLLTHYFNVQDRAQFEKAEQLLERGRQSHTKSLLFNYDDLACFSPSWKHKLPEYNEWLRPWLEGEKL